MTCLRRNFLSVTDLLLFSSGWIEDTNINPYNEHKEQMVKAGKSKGTFNKAVKEIEDFMKDPAVSSTSSYYVEVQ